MIQQSLNQNALTEKIASAINPEVAKTIANIATLQTAMLQQFDAMHDAQTQLINSIVAETTEIDEKLASMTTVGGELDTNVTAINQHTTAEKNALDAAIETHIATHLAALDLSPIKSIQRGSVTTRTNTNITVSAVNVSKAVLMVGCASGYARSDQDEIHSISSAAFIASATSITIDAGEYRTADSGAANATVHWQLIEYK